MDYHRGIGTWLVGHGVPAWQIRVRADELIRTYVAATTDLSCNIVRFKSLYKLPVTR